MVSRVRQGLFSVTDFDILPRLLKIYKFVEITFCRKEIILEYFGFLSHYLCGREFVWFGKHHANSMLDLEASRLYLLDEYIVLVFLLLLLKLDFKILVVICFIIFFW